MKQEAIPILRFEIEGMKASILTHLGVMGSDLGKALDEEITNAVNKFPWQERVDEIVYKAIHTQLQEYFQYGEGSKIIEKTINQAITNALN